MGRYGLLGRRLSHSYSPAIHRLLGSWPYDLFQVEPEDLGDFLRSGRWDGVNVTIPYKKSVVPYCDVLSPLARTLGSVNTLVRRPDGSIFGDNTDAWGFAWMLRRMGLSCHGKKALVLGSGGASVTAQYVLRQMGAEVTVISRSGPDNYSNLEQHRNAEILVNATPVGMYPQNGESPLCLDCLPNLQGVWDLVYNPIRTELIMQAEARRIPHASGLPMLVGQAARASELFIGRAVPQARLEEILREIRLSQENMILVGMPGCGKTTVGRALAKRLGRPFADGDEALEEAVGMPAAAFLERYGEAAFRAEESSILKKLGASSGLVLATGGGCVTKPENHPPLHQNGRIVWLRRDLSRLTAQGRPISRNCGVEALYKARREQYARFADLTVSNDGTVDETVQQIVEAIER